MGHKKDLSKFDAHHDAEALHKAMKGLGTDDKVLIDIFTTRPRKHIQEIQTVFKKQYGKSLKDWIKGDCSGNFEKILLALCEERTELKCKYLHDATAGIGTDEEVLIEILCPASDAELKKLNDAYKAHYKGTDLSSLIKSEISGDFKSLMVEHLKANKPHEGDVDDSKAKEDAKALYAAGEGRMGTNEKVFIEILTSRSRAHIQRVCRHYEEKTGHTLEKGVAKETSGDFCKALLALIMPEAEYHARQFHDAMAGVGTKDEKLIRLLTTLTKHQLKEANAVYTKRHNKTLISAIKSETSGSYEKVAVGLIPPIA
jgi:annexin A7/11